MLRKSIAELCIKTTNFQSPSKPLPQQHCLHRKNLNENRKEIIILSQKRLKFIYTHIVVIVLNSSIQQKKRKWINIKHKHAFSISRLLLRIPFSLSCANRKIGKRFFYSVIDIFQMNNKSYFFNILIWSEKSSFLGEFFEGWQLFFIHLFVGTVTLIFYV